MLGASLFFYLTLKPQLKISTFEILFLLMLLPLSVLNISSEITAYWEIVLVSILLLLRISCKLSNITHQLLNNLVVGSLLVLCFKLKINVIDSETYYIFPILFFLLFKKIEVKHILQTFIILSIVEGVYIYEFVPITIYVVIELSKNIDLKNYTELFHLVILLFAAFFVINSSGVLSIVLSCLFLLQFFEFKSGRKVCH